MSKTLSNLLTIFKVAKVLAKIAFILCIIGASGCVLGFFAFSAVDSFMPEQLVANGINVNVAYFELIAGTVACIGEIVFSYLAGKYFKNVLAAGTPFSFDGAKECFRLGVASIIISLAISIVSGIAAGVVVILENSPALNSDIDVSITFSTGLFFMFLSLIFKYGAELQPAPEEQPSWQETMPEEEDYQSEPDSFE